MSAEPLTLLWRSKDSFGGYRGKQGRAGGDWKVRAELAWSSVLKGDEVS